MSKTIMEKTPRICGSIIMPEKRLNFTPLFFRNSRITNVTMLHNTPSGTVEIFTLKFWVRNSRSSAQARSLNSIHPYHFLSSIVRRKKSTVCGRNCPKEARRLWSLANIRSVRSTAGCRLSTAFSGRKFPISRTRCSRITTQRKLHE